MIKANCISIRSAGGCFPAASSSSNLVLPESQSSQQPRKFSGDSEQSCAATPLPTDAYGTPGLTCTVAVCSPACSCRISCETTDSTELTEPFQASTRNNPEDLMTLVRGTSRSMHPYGKRLVLQIVTKTICHPQR